eukprot:scaffold2470_cov158-Ochromonas_danica.AAC.13
MIIHLFIISLFVLLSTTFAFSFLSRGVLTHQRCLLFPSIPPEAKHLPSSPLRLQLANHSKGRGDGRKQGRWSVIARVLRTIWSFILKVLGKAEARLQDKASAAKQLKRHQPEGVIFVERTKLERLHQSEPTPPSQSPAARVAAAAPLSTPSPRRTSLRASTSAAPSGQRSNQLERDRHYVEERLRELQRLQAVAWRNRHPGPIVPTQSLSPPAAILTEESASSILSHSSSLLSAASAAAPVVTLPEVSVSANKTHLASISAADLLSTSSDLAAPAVVASETRAPEGLDSTSLRPVLANKTVAISLGEMKPKNSKVAEIAQPEEEQPIGCSVSPLTDTMIIEKPGNSSPSSALLEQHVDDESEESIVLPLTSALSGVREDQGREDKASLSSVRLEKTRPVENGSFFIGRWKLVERRFLNNSSSSCGDPEALSEALLDEIIIPAFGPVISHTNGSTGQDWKDSTRVQPSGAPMLSLEFSVLRGCSFTKWVQSHISTANGKPVMSAQVVRPPKSHHYDQLPRICLYRGVVLGSRVIGSVYSRGSQANVASSSANETALAPFRPIPPDCPFNDTILMGCNDATDRIGVFHMIKI